MKRDNPGESIAPGKYQGRVVVKDGKRVIHLTQRKKPKVRRRKRQ